VSQAILILAPECGSFLVSFKKEVYYLKIWRRNNAKIYENKIFSWDKK
jgi:hypothetical protein